MEECGDKDTKEEGGITAERVSLRDRNVWD